MNTVLSINHDFAALAVLGVTEYQAILIETLTELEARAKTYRRSCACHSYSMAATRTQHRRLRILTDS